MYKWKYRYRYRSTRYGLLCYSGGIGQVLRRIYVPDNHELKMAILREFHMKSYSGHPGYQNTLTEVKIYYYLPNLKRDVAEFVASCFNYQRVKEECKHPGGLL